MSKGTVSNPKIVFEWGKKLDNYALRWRIDFYWFSFRVHKWLCSDDMRAYHSHPVNMLILIIRGSYIDHYIGGQREYKAPYIRLIKRNYRHFVEITTKPTWTILFTWGKPLKWDFWLRYSLKRKTRDKYFFEHGHHICDQ